MKTYEELEKENAELKRQLEERQYQLHVPIEKIAFLNQAKNEYTKKISKENREKIQEFLSIKQFLLDCHKDFIVYDTQIQERKFEYSAIELLQRKNAVLKQQLEEQRYQLHIPLECIIFKDATRHAYLKKLLEANNKEEIKKFLLLLQSVFDDDVALHFAY